MPTVNINSTVSGGSVSATTLIARTPDSVTGSEPAIPAGKDITSWVKTDSDTAAGNLPAGHGYTSGKFDVFWVESGVNKRRYGVDGTVTVNALALDGGTGDNFPASATTGIVATKQIQVNVAIDGDLASVVYFNNRLANSAGGGRGSVTLFDVSNAQIAHVDLPAAPYDIEGGASNPFTGNPITYAKVSNGSSAADGVLQIIVGQDSTP